MESIWSKTVRMRQYPALPGDMTTQVAVIGGGMAGINTAFMLHRRGFDVIVLEAKRIGSGQTCNTTAKITSQHGLMYAQLIRDFGYERAIQYAKANESAISLYKSIIEESKIDCDFQILPAHLYSQVESDVIQDEAEAARRVGIDASVLKNATLPFPVKSVLRFENQAMFHPLKYLNSIAQDLQIFENTVVQTVEGRLIKTNHGDVTADYVVFASHFPFINFPGYYFLRMVQDRSYVIALENAPMLDGMYLGIDDQGWSLRNHQGMLLFGGLGHKSGNNTSGGQYDRLQSAVARFYPQSREIARWSAQDCMTLDNVPYIGAYSSSSSNWYVATGFRKWGMTSSMVSALILSDLIEGKHNPYAETFSPQRFEPKASASEFIKLGATAAKGLFKTWLGIPRATLEELPCGHGGIVSYESEKAGVYKDENGQCYAVSIRCPHLGCELSWNPDELSWDCPCHGSRFDIRGQLINNPAQEDLESSLIEQEHG